MTTNSLYPLALVCDEKDKLVGVIGSEEANPIRYDLKSKSCGEICNTNFLFLRDGKEDAIYREARNRFAERQLKTLLVVDKNGSPTKVFGKFQAFFSRYV